jgi:hypothetical protein
LKRPHYERKTITFEAGGGRLKRNSVRTFQ